MSGNNVTDFEKDLCKRIIDICDYSEVPNCEANIHLALCFEDLKSIDRAYFFKRIKNTELQNKFNELEKVYTKKYHGAKVNCKSNGISYIPTNIERKNIDSDSKFEEILSSEKIPNYFPFSTDIVYCNGKECNILEIKYPHAGHKWNYSQWGSPDHTSAHRFTTPFLEINKNKYIMGMYQEGSMIVDFVRMLKTYKAGLKNKSCPNINGLYFVAFFETNDFCRNNKFEDNIGHILKYYLEEEFNFIVTEGKNKKLGTKPIDLHDLAKPKQIEFFTLDVEDVKRYPFESNNHNFRCLKWGKSLVAFLVKIEPNSSSQKTNEPPSQSETVMGTPAKEGKKKVLSL